MTAVTLDVGRRDGRDRWRGGTDVRPMKIVLVFNAGGNCIGVTALMSPPQFVGR